MKFLEKVVEDIIKIPDFYKDIFLFPTKRSVIFFEKYLKQNIENPALFPYAKSLREFVYEITELNPLDRFQLTFELFFCYLSIFKDEILDNFFLWSQILLNDFEEIDLSGNSSKKILKNTAELQKIDEYVKSFDKENPSEFRKRYFYFWDQLGNLYEQFRNQIIKQKKSSYYGYAIKYLNFKLKNKQISLKGRNIYFIGFSDLQKSELEFAKIMNENERAKFYFDVDNFFLQEENKKSEIYQLFKRFHPIPITSDNYLNTNSLKIYTIPCRNSIEQFKFCQIIIKDLMNKNKEKIPFDEYALILNDSKTLEIAINSLPEELTNVNITLGYPLEKTHIAKVIIAFLELKNQKSNFNNSLLKIVHEPYINLLLKNEEFSLNSSKDFNVENIKNLNFIKNWLETNNFFEAIEFLQNWIIHLKEHKEINFTEFEKQQFYWIYIFLTKLKNNLEYLKLETEWHTFLVIFKKLIQTEFIPFSGEPLQGLQIMEIQESQCLDFQYVFLMNINEGSLPKSPDHSSFIPMEFKKSYGLRTPEDLDARYAYLFYRLFHRSKEIYLFYNQNEEEEESRFIKQIQYLFKNFNNIEMETLSFSLPNYITEVKAIEINKDNQILNKIKEKMKIGISPTSLITYLQCPLKFYYTYIEKIKEEEIFEEDLQANEFGTIAHDTLEEIYKSLNKNFIKTIPTFLIKVNELEQKFLNNQLNLDEIILKKFNELKKNKDENISGKNNLLLKVIEEIVKKIIVNDIKRYKDLQYADVQIYGLEKELTMTLNIENLPIKLYGKIDKIEKYKNDYLIIDYKSGRIGKTMFQELSCFENEISKHKEAFQLLFYSMLLSNQLNSTNNKIHSSIYSFRNLHEGLIYLQDKNKNCVDYKNIKLNFENFIKDKIEEILKPSETIKQTTNEDDCKYCPYIKNCGKFHLLQ